MNSKEVKVEQKDGDFNSFISHIFNSPPQKPNSIQIGNLQFDSEQDTLRFLLAVFCQGIQILFKTDKVYWDSVSESDLDLVNKYFVSFGWKISVEKNKNIVVFTGFNIETQKFLNEYATINLN